MHDIEKLEKEWRIYKLKQFKPIAITVGIIGAGYLFFIGSTTLVSYSLVLTRPAIAVMSKNKIHLDQQESVAQPQKVASQEMVKVSSSSNQTIKQDENPKELASVILQPDTNFLTSFSYKEPPKDWPNEEKRRAPKEAQHLSSVTTPPKSVEPSPPVTQHHTSKSLVIQTKTSHNTLEHLIERFNNSREPKLATYIASMFYKRKQYQDAIRWSIIANSLEPSNEESWLLYAKAKVQLGERDDAIRALRIYLDQYTSKKIRSYLHTLEHNL
ncbi:MAG: hypothetical protein DSY46_00685 [Hydrogenimonas sp.]|nr:MAG: hypothetical protein DSY46_00685 [Hydrogenimonas sp.]